MQENSELILFRRDINPRINIRLKYLIQRISRFYPKPDCRSTGTVDRPPYTGRPHGRPKKPESGVFADRTFRSTRPVDPENPRVGFLQSGTSVDRAGRPPKTLCMLCTSVDRPGRPTLLSSLLLLFPATVSLPFIVDFLGDLRRHLAALGNLLQHLAMTSPPLISSLLQQFSTSVKIFQI